jgi:hypothetical protein
MEAVRTVMLARVAAKVALTLDQMARVLAQTVAAVRTIMFAHVAARVALTLAQVALTLDQVVLWTVPSVASTLRSACAQEEAQMAAAWIILLARVATRVALALAQVAAVMFILLARAEARVAFTFAQVVLRMAPAEAQLALMRIHSRVQIAAMMMAFALAQTWRRERMQQSACAQEEARLELMR